MSDMIQLDQAKIDAALSQLACAQGDHRWKFIGCGGCCCDDIGGCSLPVHTCQECGDCDYGENEESDQIRAKCASERQP